MAKQPRKAMSKKTRFEVFKRDSFICQYCGRSAPDVLLEVDHIEPHSKGGSDDVTNLVTSCVDCNRGKSDRVLSSKTQVEVEKRQLDELNERRNQLQLMLAWKKELLGINKEAAMAAVEMFEEATGMTVTDTGIAEMSGLVRKYGLGEVIDSIQIAADTYSPEMAFSKVGGILYCRRRSQSDPDYQTVIRIKGMMRRRQFYINEGLAEQLIREAIATGRFSAEDLIDCARTAKNWTQWKTEMEFAVAPTESEV